MAAALLARLSRRRLIVGLWVVAVALTIAVVLGATRVLGHGRSSRGAVAQYIDRVNAIQRRTSFSLTQVPAAYRDFSARGATPRTLAELSAAEHALRTLDRRLTALPAPADAVKLREMLLRLVRREALIAHESTGLARFLPAFRRLSAITTAADRQLGHDLSAAAPPGQKKIRGTPAEIEQARAAYAVVAARAARAQAAAVETFDRTLKQVVEAMRLLRPPAVMAPLARATLRTLEATAAAGGRLAAELRQQNRSHVAQLSRALSEAARLSQGVLAQRSEIAAVKAYNVRVRGVARAETRIQAEIARLQRDVR